LVDYEGFGLYLRGNIARLATALKRLSASFN
jgi:hypothetical protein